MDSARANMYSATSDLAEMMVVMDGKEDLTQGYSLEPPGESPPPPPPPPLSSRSAASQNQSSISQWKLGDGSLKWENEPGPWQEEFADQLATSRSGTNVSQEELVTSEGGSQNDTGKSPSWFQSHRKWLLGILFVLLGVGIGLTAYFLFGRKKTSGKKCGVLDTSAQDSYSMSGNVQIEGRNQMRFICPASTPNLSATPSMLLWHPLLQPSWECTFSLHNRRPTSVPTRVQTLGVEVENDLEATIPTSKSFCFIICGHDRNSSQPITFSSQRMITLCVRDDDGKKARQVKVRCDKHILRLWVDDVQTSQTYKLCPMLDYTCGLGGHFWNENYDYQVKDFCLLDVVDSTSDDPRTGVRVLPCPGQAQETSRGPNNRPSVRRMD